MSYSVQLYVYDISNGFGIYHTSVVVHNVEIVFNAHGLLIHRMAELIFERPYKIEYMGQTSCSYNQLLNYVNTLSNNQFQASKYDVYSNNCIEFCKVLVAFLCDGTIPEYVQIAPRLGRCTRLGRLLKPLFAACSARNYYYDGP